MFARTCSRSGFHCYGLNSYQSAIRGGHVWFQVRGSEQKVKSHGDNVDILIALNSESADIHAPFVSPGGVIIYDKDRVKFSGNLLSQKARALPMPLGQISRKFDKNPIMQNTVALGAALYLLGLDFKVFETVIGDTFGKKKESVITANIQAATSGYEYAKSNFSQLEVTAKPPSNPRPKMLMTGNQAICLGAVMAGCKFYAAYPMTPASGLLHWMAAHATRCGVVVKQAEDELAVINMGIGAAHAGVRAMVGTSGGGFSLMVEALGLAGMTETPIVIVESQRAGPSTGLPTKTEQGDLNMMLGASQGDFPRIVLSPLTVEDAYYATIEAFNLAERFQCPVILASDLLLSEHIETVDSLSKDVLIDRGEWANSTQQQPFLRYKVTETGISPRAIPGNAGTIFVAASDEHDESGVVISDVLAGIPKYVAERKKQMDKRMRKLEVARTQMPPPKVYGPQEADITIVCWGSTFGVVYEVVDTFGKTDGIRVNAIAFRNIWPFNAEKAEPLLKSAKKVLDVECNYSAQLARLIRAETGFEIRDRLLKYDGEPIYPYEVIGKIREVISRNA